MPTSVTRTRGVRVTDLARLAVAWAASTVALIITGALLPGFSATSWWAYAAVAAAAGIVGLVLRPALVEISARVGWLAVLLTALIGQALIMYVAIRLVPGIESTAWTALAATWVSAVVGTLISWATTAGTDDGLITSLAGRARRQETVSDPEVDGVLFVQLDAFRSRCSGGRCRPAPYRTIRRWITSGDYTLHEWTLQLPCTTPASQLGILHGTVAGVPAFRWNARNLAGSSSPASRRDAAVIEERSSNGRGLLADGGLSAVEPLHRGRPSLDADDEPGGGPARLARKPAVRSPGSSLSPERVHAQLHADRRGDRQGALAGPTTGQARPRPAGAPGLDLRPAAGSHQRPAARPEHGPGRPRSCVRGTKSIYVDYVDYDEIAHHAGMFRPESLAALDGLDRTLGIAGTARCRTLPAATGWWCSRTTASPRAPRSLTGMASRSAICVRNSCRKTCRCVDASVEGLGRADSIAGDVAAGGMTGKLAVRAGEGLAKVQQTPAAG